MQNPTTSGKQRIRSAYGDCPYYVIIAGGKDCILRVFWGHSWIEGKRGDEDDLPQTWCPDACDTNMTQAWILCLSEIRLLSKASEAIHRPTGTYLD